MLFKQWENLRYNYYRRVIYNWLKNTDELIV